MALTDNLVSYYKLDGNSNDSVGVNNGTDTSITYSVGNGKIVQGAGCNGSTSKVNCGTNSSLDFGTGSCTISCWAKTSTTATQAVVSKRHYGGSGFNCFVSNGGKIYADGGGTNGVFTPTQSINTSDGNWHHLVFVYDRTAGYLKLYVDSTFDGQTVLGATTLTDTTYLTLGALGQDNVYFLNGAMDEVGIWSRALTAGEVSQLYNGGNGLAYPLSTGNSNFFMFF